jgi:hypothetical protein
MFCGFDLPNWFHFSQYGECVCGDVAGIELMRSGKITLPRPEKELLITIRTGNYGSLDRVLNLANTLFAELEKAEADSRLPEKVDKSKISKFVSEAYLRFWNKERQVDDTHPDTSR